MLFRLLHCVGPLPKRRVARSVRRPFAVLAIVALLAAGSAVPTRAESPNRPPRGPSLAATATPSPTPKLKITTRPHLLSVGPMGLDVKPVAGPRLRQPPLLPTPKPTEPDPETSPTNAKPQEPAPLQMPVPSELSPDAAPTLLPTEKPASTPAPEKKFTPKESALEPVDRVEPDLKDAVMYFETPVGPHGARATIPLAVPFSSPAPVPVPESRATYRKEKE